MSRTGARASTKSVVRKSCQGRTRGVVPRIQRQFMRVKLDPTVDMARKTPVSGAKEAE